MSNSAATTAGRRSGRWGWPVVVSFVRLPLIALGALAVWIVLVVTGHGDAFLFPLGATLSMNLVNLACVLLLARLLRREGRRLRELLGFDRARLGRDLAWGLCWLVVLNTVFMVAFVVPLLIADGPAGLVDGSVFERAFVGAWADAPGDALGPGALTAIALWLLAFPFLNAPVEELQYRAYAQPRLQAVTRRGWVAVAVPSLGFGLQHVVFAPSVLGAVAYTSAFFVWGLGAGLIYRRQGRLMPLVIAHFITNLPFGFAGIAFLVWA